MFDASSFQFRFPCSLLDAHVPCSCSFSNAVVACHVIIAFSRVSFSIALFERCCPCCYVLVRCRVLLVVALVVVVVVVVVATVIGCVLLALFLFDVVHCHV